MPGPVDDDFDTVHETVVATWESREPLEPDDQLAVGVALQHIGTGWGRRIGSVLQAEALEEGSGATERTRLRSLRPGRDLLIDIHRHDCASIVLANDSREDRAGFATMRRLMETDPRPPLETLDDLALSVDGAAAGIRWGSTEFLLVAADKADAAWVVQGTAQTEGTFWQRSEEGSPSPRPPRQ